MRAGELDASYVAVMLYQLMPILTFMTAWSVILVASDQLLRLTRLSGLLSPLANAMFIHLTYLWKNLLPAL